MLFKTPLRLDDGKESESKMVYVSYVYQEKHADGQADARAADSGASES